MNVPSAIAFSYTIQLLVNISKSTEMRRSTFVKSVVKPSNSMLDSFVIVCAIKQTSNTRVRFVHEVLNVLLVLTVTRLHMKQKESTLAKCVEIPSNVKERSPVIKLYILMCDLIRVISVKKHSET
jgi:hypothetical protein